MKDDSSFEAEFRVRYDYLFTHGGLSPFFRSLRDDMVILGATCGSCDITFCPPRKHCKHCHNETTWSPLSGNGAVEAASYVTFVPRSDRVLDYIDLPYTLAMIRLDGAANSLLSIVHQPAQRLGDVKKGLRVSARFREKREGRLTDFYFVPASSA